MISYSPYSYVSPIAGAISVPTLMTSMRMADSGIGI
jgi:hypothetical protein